MKSAPSPTLLPCPRLLNLKSGTYLLPTNAVLYLPADLPRETVLLPIAERLQSAAEAAGVCLELVTGPAAHPRLSICAFQDSTAPDHPEGYALEISAKGIRIV